MERKYKKIFVVIILLVLIFIGTFSYIQIRKWQTRVLISGYQDNIKDNIEYIDVNIHGVERNLLSIARNPVVQKILLGKYENFLQAKNEMNGYVEVSLWNLVTSSSSYIKGLVIYSYKDIPDIGHFVQSGAGLERVKWYKTINETKKRVLYADEGNLYMVYPIFRLNSFDIIGAIKVSINIERITTLLDNSASNKGWQLSLDDTILAHKLKYKNGIILKNMSKKTGIGLKYFINDKYVRKATLVIFVLLLISCILIMVLFIYYNSRLTKEHNKILDEKKKQEYQQQLVLKAQINPHFLYNIMSMINWKAKACGQEEISNICRELSGFYRTALNKGKDEITIEEELLNVESYLKLKLNLSETPFRYEISCPVNLKKMRIINFILQPIVENAILYGIGPLDGSGFIRIKVYTENKILCISVTDNGINEGLNQEQFFKNVDGYGIRNVHERIELKYGKGFGVFLNLKQGETEVILKLKHI